jgi:CheY-like chemotaxis protein
VPTRRGFGSVIIERVVPFDLQGTALVSYLPAGLEAEFFIPEKYLAFSGQLPQQSPQSPTPGTGTNYDLSVESKPLQGLRVLLLEDNLIVALEAEDLLQSLGAASVMAFSSIAAATNAYQTTSIDFAVLDVNLGFESSLGFAEMLRRADTPFVFASGYGDQKSGGESRMSELSVSKPYDRESLRDAIALTLARSH